MLDKETVTIQGGTKPGLEEEAFFECLNRAKEQVENENLIRCFDRAMDIKED